MIYRKPIGSVQLLVLLICLHLGFVQVVYDLQETYRECTVVSIVYTWALSRWCMIYRKPIGSVHLFTLGLCPGGV